MSVDPPDAASAQPASAFEPEAEAKRLLRVVRSGALATLTASGDPFSSLVSVATEPDGSPLILVSQLSAHTRHLDRDGRCSLLLAETGEGDPLRHARLTVTGTAGKLTAAADRAAARTRFLARHPQAALYVDFGDFSFWRVAMREIHLNGGFARAARFPAARVATSLAGADALLAAEAGALAHMNADHADALALYAPRARRPARRRLARHRPRSRRYRPRLRRRHGAHRVSRGRHDAGGAAGRPGRAGERGPRGGSRRALSRRFSCRHIA